MFTNVTTPRAWDPKGSLGYKPTLVGERASVEVNATILCGHIIGRYAPVAAGAVAMKDVLQCGLMVGIPARRVGWVCECGQILNEKFVCPDYRKNFRKVCLERGNAYFVLYFLPP